MYYEKLELAPTGSTGNFTGSAVYLGDYEALAFQFVVEAVGGTPTVTYKFQGTEDGANWYDIGYITDATDTVAVATRVRTTVGADVEFLANPVARKYIQVRVVVSANTNCTIRAEAYRIG